ncbi:hypothetical protein ABZW47_31015 [Streptomyces sp. NPDC004549]|uniref:hypothetical protein n=1 Tax=Streptomyces sp. NPDC004549 TaxID=3154283 RepID=UPI0033B913BD
MLLRACDAELARRADLVLKTARDELDSHFTRWLAAAERALKPEPVPLARTAGFQLDMILSTADLLTC